MLESVDSEVFVSKIIAESWLEAFRAKDLSRLNLADGFVHSSPFGLIEGKAAYLEMVNSNPEAFFENTIEVVDLIGEGKQFAIRYLVNGTPACDCIYIENGQIAKIIAYFQFQPD